MNRNSSSVRAEALGSPVRPTPFRRRGPSAPRRGLRYHPRPANRPWLAAPRRPVSDRGRQRFAAVHLASPEGRAARLGHARLRTSAAEATSMRGLSCLRLTVGQERVTPVGRYSELASQPVAPTRPPFHRRQGDSSRAAPPRRIPRHRGPRGGGRHLHPPAEAVESFTAIASRARRTERAFCSVSEETQRPTTAAASPKGDHRDPLRD